MLPVHVIDEDLYDEPADVPARHRRQVRAARVGPGLGQTVRPSHGAKQPPSLIIQDELHLLTGPLGTTVGLYEAAINLLCESDGHAPEGHRVDCDHPSGWRADQGSLRPTGRPVPAVRHRRRRLVLRADRRRMLPGRLYVGMMAQGHTSDTAVVHTGAALLQAPVDLQLDRRGQGRLLDGRRLPQLAPGARSHGHHRARRHPGSRLASLIVGRPNAVSTTSRSFRRRCRAPQQPRLLERLNRCRTPTRTSIDFLATTNMLSVGVDVPRLGLMLMNGQPKATAEYIQATSRVGRSSTPWPGLRPVPCHQTPRPLALRELPRLPLGALPPRRADQRHAVLTTVARPRAARSARHPRPPPHRTRR